MDKAEKGKVREKGEGGDEAESRNRLKEEKEVERNAGKERGREGGICPTVKWIKEEGREE